MFANGEGVQQDFAQAAVWYRKAADQGNDNAQNNLGFLYERGEGVVQSNALAKSWYQKAANQGNALAKSNLTKLARAAELALHPPQVTEQDAFAIFQTSVFDYEAARINVVDGQFEQYDVHQKISRRYAESQTEEHRALIVALVAIRAEVQFTDEKQGIYTKRFDGAELADTAAWEAVKGYRYSVWRFGIEQYFRDNEKLQAAVTKYSTWTVISGGKSTPLLKAMTHVADELLLAAYSGNHRTADLGTFLTGYVMRSGEGTAFAQARAAAITLGLK